MYNKKNSKKNFEYTLSKMLKKINNEVYLKANLHLF